MHMPCSGSYTMEDWLHFVETYSAYVFKLGILCINKKNLKDMGEQHYQDMWAIIVELVEHYCRPNTRLNMLAVLQSPVAVDDDDDIIIKGTAQGARRGADLGLKLAKQMEKHQLPDRLFTSNLHMLCCRCGSPYHCWDVEHMLPGHDSVLLPHVLACRLPKQEAARGYVSKDGDQSTERLMQAFKSSIDRRVSHFPEKTYVNKVLTKRLLAKGTEPHMAPQRVSEPRDECRLLGNGTMPSAKIKAAIVDAATTLFYTPDGRKYQLGNELWQDLDVDGCDVHHLLHSMRVHTSATLPGSGGNVVCFGFGRCSSRANHMVQLDYVTSIREKGRHVERVVPHAAVAHMFVVLQHPGQLACPMHMALVEFMNMKPPAGRALVATRPPELKYSLVPVCDISCKLVCACDGNHMTPRRVMYLMPMGRTY